MGYIDVKELDLKFKNLNYCDINISLMDKHVYGIFARNKELVNHFLLMLAGIIPCDTIKHAQHEVFENQDFFKSRIYMDFKLEYLKTININKIAVSMKDKFNLKINKDVLKDYINSLSLRSECDIVNQCDFTTIGNTLMNFSLVASCEIKDIIINNPTINLENSKLITLVSKDLTNLNKYNLVILGLDNLYNFKGLLNKMIIFTDYFKALLVDPYLEDCLILTGDARKLNELIPINDKLFYTYKNDIFQMIVLNRLNKDTLKLLDGNKIKFQKITLYEIEKYM